VADIEYAEAGDLYEMRASLSRVFEEIVESRKGAAGVYISPESSLRCSAVLSCVRVLAESMAAMPSRCKTFWLTSPTTG